MELFSDADAESMINHGPVHLPVGHVCLVYDRLGNLPAGDLLNACGAGIVGHSTNHRGCIFVDVVHIADVVNQLS